jgi:integrase
MRSRASWAATELDRVLQVAVAGCDARRTELPGSEPRELQPWSMGEALSFLQAARPDPLYPAFVLLLLYGMRRCEVLGLRWQDLDLTAGEIRIRQQLLRVRGSLHAGPV